MFIQVYMCHHSKAENILDAVCHYSFIYYAYQHVFA